ncbi:hypothetical protein [Eubacterium sp.]
MKKSFKNAVAILLAVMMIVCSLPMTVLAADSSRSNIALQFGDVSCASTAKTYNVTGHKATDFISFSGLNSDKLDYNKSTGKIVGYGVGEFFTVTVLMENVKELSAAEVAINYSNSIEPAFVKNTRGGVATATYSESGNPIADFPKEAAVPAHSGNAIHNGTTFTVGETSYVDTANRVMHANFAVQNGTDSVSTTSVKAGKYTYSNTAVLATFMFKIVNDKPITFSIAKDANDKYRTYYLDSIKNGGPISEYKLYDQVSNESPALDFLGENEYNGSTTKTYTVTFLDENGAELQKDTYEENAQIINVPAFPASVKVDGENHTAYKWDKDVPANATADVTIQRVKFNEAHDWGEWNETKPATTTEKGLKERECSVCHAKETADIPMLPETHVHKWSEWKYNNDAVYVSKTDYKDGTATRKCTDPDCPTHATETKTIVGSGILRANTTSVTLGAAVVLNVGVDKSRTAPFKSTYVKFEFAGESYDISDVSNRTTETRWFYDFDKVSPDKFGEEVTITPYGVTEDGILCRGISVKSSIKDYAYKTLNKTTNVAMKELLVEMLYYGAAYQNYRNYKVDQLVTDNLTEEQKTLHTTDIPEYVKLTNSKFELNPNGEDKNLFVVKTAALLLEGKVIPQMRIEIPKTTKITDYVFTWKVNNKVVEFTYAEHPEWFVPATPSAATANVNDSYFIQCTILQANQFSIPFYLTAYKGSVSEANQVSNVFRYSVESYATGSVVKNDPVLKALVDQILRYGRADVKYMGGTADL